MRSALKRAVSAMIAPLLFVLVAAQGSAQTLSGGAVAQMGALLTDKANRSPQEQKLDSNLLFAMRAVTQKLAGHAAAQPAYVDNFIRQNVNADNTVSVTIRGKVTQDLLAALTSVGAQNVAQYPIFDTVTARVPITALLTIAAQPDVRFIRALEKPLKNVYIPAPGEVVRKAPRQLRPVEHVGSVTSEGVVAHSADLAQNTGINGKGVFVCVLSDGVDSYVARQGTGDLPNPLFILSGQQGAGDEGTAMLEIVYDMAPGTSLGFATAFNGEASFATNILGLQSAGCNIIIDDVTYFVESAFQDGTIAQAVNTVTAAGAMYLSAAANSGNLASGSSGTWQGDWQDSGATITYSRGTAPMQKFGAHFYDVLTSNTSNAIVLEWSDPNGGSSNDYDLFLVDSTFSTILAQSSNVQNGAQDANESFGCDPFACPAGSLVVVAKFSGATRALRVDTARGTLSVNTNGSTFGHNAAGTALTIAATDVANAGGVPFTGGASDPVEFFSSDGPRTLFYNPNGSAITAGKVTFASGGGTTLNKVDITAADGVSTAEPGSSGLNPFFGTSAATPHAAGIAALIKQANPSASAATIKAALFSSALDIMTPGFDVESGHGIVMAPASLRAVLTPLTVSKSFSPPAIDAGGTATLTLTLTNSNAVALKNVAFTDTYPAQIKNSASPNPGKSGSAGCAGTLTAAASGGSFSMTSGVVPAGGACNLFVTVTSATVGGYVDSSGAVTTPIALNSPGALAALVVGLPCGSGIYPFPYTDVGSVTNPFCPGIMEAYVTGISKGTTPTTFSPNTDVIRLQMTTFLQRTVDEALARGSQRAALNQWPTPRDTNAMQTIAVGGTPSFCAADGETIWTSNFSQVVEVQANTGKVLGMWTGAASGEAVLVAAGKVFVAGHTTPGSLYVIDPTQAPGAVTLATATLGASPYGIAFDGTYVWTANILGSVSYVTPQSPYTVTTVSTGFTNPKGILYDGAHIWVTDNGAGTLLKLDASGSILQTVTVGASPEFPVFDGANIWVPNFGDNSVTVVQASTGNVVATIITNASNLLSRPDSASFDGERILVTNSQGNSVTVFKAADLSFIANVATGASSNPAGACSDGINFWVDLFSTGKLLRF